MSTIVEVSGNDNEEITVGVNTPEVDVSIQSNQVIQNVEIFVDEFAAQTANDAADRAEQALEDIEAAIANKTDRGGYPGTSQDIVNLIQDTQLPDAVLKYGDIITDELNVHVSAADFQWRINKVDFLTASEYDTVIDPATDNFYRTDALLGNNAGEYQILKGIEDATSSSEPTELPAGTIRLGLIHVFGATITTVIVDVSGFITKASKGFIRLFYAGNVDAVPVDDKSYLKFEPGMLSLKSLQISDSTFLYHGRDFIIKNGTTGNVTLFHMQGTGNFRFNFPGAHDLIVKPEESVHIVMRAINDTNNGGLLDFVGITSELGAQIVAAPEKLTINDNDKVGLADSEDSNKTKHWKFSTIKAAVKTYFDTLYLGTGTDQEVTGIKTFRTGKFGLRNVANTFTSFFTNTATASRTWALPDKNGTVAMISDIPTNIVITGTQNVVPKYGSAGTSLINSRITENGTRILVDDNTLLELDFQFGSTKDVISIGNERAAAGFDGSSFAVKAGDTSNSQSANFVRKLNTNITLPPPTSVFSSNFSDNVYACAGTVMYKYTRETGLFVQYATGLTTGGNIYGGCESPAGDVFFINQNRQIYKQTAGSGAFLLYATIPAGAYGSGMTITPNNDIYACVFHATLGAIYKQTNSTGSFVDTGAPPRNYYGLTSDLNNNVYVGVGGNNNFGGTSGFIYKQTNSIGTFVQLGTISSLWVGIAWDRIENALFGLNSAGFYKFAGGFDTTVTLELGFGGAFCGGLAFCRSVLYTAWMNTGGNNQQGIYVYTTNTVGTIDSNGGTLRLKSGVGKGKGKSKIEFITGQKTVSGTNVQTEALRAYYDENGNYIFLTIPTYANDAAADADANLPSKAYYKITGNRALYQKP